MPNCCLSSAANVCSQHSIQILPPKEKKDFEVWIKKEGYGFGSVVMPLRLALVGALEGVDVFEIVHCIGKPEAVSRINALKDRF